MTKEELIGKCPWTPQETDCYGDGNVYRGVRSKDSFNPDWNTEAVLVEEMQRMAKRIEELEALAQPKEQEPVAWMFQHEETGRMNYVSNDGIHDPTMFLGMNPRYALVCPLYTTPPHCKPPEWYAQWLCNNYQDHPNIATLCEEMTKAAHGIKG